MPLKRLINRKLAKKNASITNQRLKAFNRGNIISLQQSIKGIKTLPNPPINIGIIIKKIIKIPWKVIQELYWREEQIRNPGKANSNRIIIDIPNPNEPPIKPDKIYTPPIKIWFVVQVRRNRLFNIINTHNYHKHIINTLS